ncbi:MAG: type I secretion system permease/ATPase [Pseudooceanicola sp.]|nr:type I secretion system permease/ATPase [Pseudooceanicola sp.]
MNRRPQQTGYDELRAARRANRALYWAVGLFSAVSNMLMLTGPIYMLQVYDRVLGSGSMATLTALSLIAAFLFLGMGLLDLVRARVLSRAAARFQSRLDARVFDTAIRRSASAQGREGHNGIRDLDAVHKLMASPALVAAYDLPWTPVFLAGIAIFHPWLALLALSGGGVLILVAILNQMITRAGQSAAAQATVQCEALAHHIRAEGEAITALGMQSAASARWLSLRNAALVALTETAELTAGFTYATRTFRLFLQSAMLGLGAYLVLQDALSAGAMIAGSILMGRALVPVEMVIAHWPTVQAAMRGWHALADALRDVPSVSHRTLLPVPEARLDVTQITVIPPGEATAALRMVSLSLPPGQAIGVIGPTGAGKSSLARALTGVWQPAGGAIRLGGAALDHYDVERLGRYIGYLPQRVQLFAGSVADNIARLDASPDPAAIVRAAMRADAHEMILRLPGGYDTRIDAGGSRLSGGQIQRIALARAMYGDPLILVLDEPNSNLDNEGTLALNAAIRAMKADGKSALIMAHRPAAIRECDLILKLDNGAVTAFGPREEVLDHVLRNASQVRVAGQGGLQ